MVLERFFGHDPDKPSQKNKKFKGFPELETDEFAVTSKNLGMARRLWRRLKIAMDADLRRSIDEKFDQAADRSLTQQERQQVSLGKTRQTIGRMAREFEENILSGKTYDFNYLVKSISTLVQSQVESDAIKNREMLNDQDLREGQVAVEVQFFIPVVRALIQKLNSDDVQVYRQTVTQIGTLIDIMSSVVDVTQLKLDLGRKLDLKNFYSGKQSRELELVRFSDFSQLLSDVSRPKGNIKEGLAALDSIEAMANLVFIDQDHREDKGDFFVQIDRVRDVLSDVSGAEDSNQVLVDKQELKERILRNPKPFSELVIRLVGYYLLFKRIDVLDEAITKEVKPFVTQAHVRREIIQAVVNAYQASPAQNEADMSGKIQDILSKVLEQLRVQVIRQQKPTGFRAVQKQPVESVSPPYTVRTNA